MNDELISQLEKTGDYRVIKRFVPVDFYHPVDDLKWKIGVYLDTETTGLNAETDKIIELAMVPFEFHSSGKIYRVLPAYNGFQIYPGYFRPGKPADEPFKFPELSPGGQVIQEPLGLNSNTVCNFMLLISPVGSTVFIRVHVLF